MPRQVAVNLYRKTRPGNLATRIHGFSEPAATNERITNMNLTRLQKTGWMSINSQLGRIPG